MPTTKAALRAEAAQRIAALEEYARLREEFRLQRQLTDLVLARTTAADSVLGYYPLPDEPHLLPAFYEIARTRSFCLPRVRSDGGMDICLLPDFAAPSAALVRGAFGIPEPSADCPLVRIEDLAVVIVPGRAFTRNGQRLGRGKGFYDRFLSRTPAWKIAPAFACQIFPALPLDNHDQPVDEVCLADGAST